MTTTLERYQRIAPFYDLLDLPFEYRRYRRIRPLMFAGLRGRILDAGVGTGRNAAFYPPGSQVIGIDLSPAMLARALIATPWPQHRCRPAGNRSHPGGVPLRRA